jgi:hypothetical protein
MNAGEKDGWQKSKSLQGWDEVYFLPREPQGGDESRCTKEERQKIMRKASFSALVL